MGLVGDKCRTKRDIFCEERVTVFVVRTMLVEPADCLRVLGSSFFCEQFRLDKKNKGLRCSGEDVHS